MKRSWMSGLAVVSLMAITAACKNTQTPTAQAPVETPAKGTPGAPPAGPASSAGTVEPTPGSPATRVASRCPANQAVTSDDLTEVGGALVRAYRAALKGNTPDAFAEFQAAFQPDADRNHLKTQIFPRVVEHVGKYVAGPSDPSITLCRVEKQTGERIKVFVQSRDPRKSDPPSLLVLHDGKWLLDSMTP